MLPKSRRTWLAIAFAITAIAVLTINITQYVQERRHPNYSPIGYHYIPGRSVVFPPNYSKIEEGLWMGGQVEQPPPGTDAVLNVCETKDSFELAAEQWDPIHDSPPAPDLDWLRRQVEFITSERSAGRTVYVHCYGGVSRSGMVMAAYYMRREGWSANQAIKFLQSKRPAVSPNPAFLPLLAAWERSLKTTARSDSTRG